MRATIAIGTILVVLGVGTLAYFASPVRMMMSAYVPHNANLNIPIAGGLLLACGIVLLFISRTRKP